MPLMRSSSGETLDMNPAFKALKYYYQTYYHHLWGEYGPRDSFNHNKEFSNAYLGIDVGPEVLMIENYRSGLLWNNFMKNEKVLAAAIKVFGDGVIPDPATIYVDVANMGDANQDGSVGHPFDNIQGAINAAKGSATISIKAGTYAEHILLKSGVTLRGSGGNIDTPEDLSDDTIVDAGNNGVAVYCNGVDNAVIESLTIINGYGGVSAGNIVCQDSSLKIRNNLIMNSSTTYPPYGGYGGGLIIHQSNLTEIVGNVIKNNWAWYGGGGIYCVNFNGIIRNNIIRGNSADWGGGIYCENSSPTIENNIFDGNFADYRTGGGIHCQSFSSPKIINNTFVNNWANGFGGAVYVAENCAPVILNNVITKNRSNSSAGGIRCQAAPAILDYNDVYLNTNGNYSGCTPGPGSISQDPLFVDLTSRNYRLQPSSPCINTGSPDQVYNDSDGTRNDMGAYGGPNSL